MFEVNTGVIYQTAIKVVRNPRKLEGIKKAIYKAQDRRGMELTFKQAIKLVPGYKRSDEIFKTLFWSRYKPPEHLSFEQRRLPLDKYLKYYYLRKDLFITPNDKDYPYFLMLQVFIYEDPFELDKFLDYQYEKCKEAQIDFFRITEIVMKAHETHNLFETNILKLNQSLFEDWVIQKKKILKAKKSPEMLKRDRFSKLSKAQAILVVYYTFKFYGIEPRTTSGVAPLAKLTHMFLNKPLSKVPNSDVYKMFLKAPNLKGDERLLRDLIIVKEIFLEYELAEIAELVEDEIKICKENQKSTKELGG